MENFIRSVANFIDNGRLKMFFGTHLSMKIRYFNIVMVVISFFTLVSSILISIRAFSLAISSIFVGFSVFFLVMCILGNITKKFNLFIIIVTYVFNLVFLPFVYFWVGEVFNGVWLYFIGGLILSILFVQGPAFVATIIIQPLYYLLLFYSNYTYREFFQSIKIYFSNDLYNSFSSFPHLFMAINFIIISIIVGILIKTLFVSYMDKRDAAYKMAQKLQDLSIKDPLTGIYNRRYLFSYIEDVIESSQDDNAPISIVMYDIDNFKKLNDNYGHLIGDEVLCAISKILSQTCRDYDIVARFGGEEFILVFPGTKESVAFYRADHIRKEIEKTKFSDQIYGTVTVSGGVASYESGMSAEKLIDIADRNLYQAKNSGRNKIVWKCGAPSPVKKLKSYDSYKQMSLYRRRVSDISNDK